MAQMLQGLAQMVLNRIEHPQGMVIPTQVVKRESCGTFAGMLEEAVGKNLNVR
jgi:hypothetical protein